MGKYGSLNRFLDLVSTIGLILACVVVLLLPSDNIPYKNRISERLRDFSKGWRTGENQEIQLIDVGRMSVKDEKGKNRILIYHALPSDLAQDTFINFRTKSIRFKVKIGERTIYNFHPKENYSLARGTGHSFHSIPLMKYDGGHKIFLEIEPDYRDGSSAIRLMYIGRPSDFQGMILDEKLLSFILCIFTLSVGILLVTTSLATKSQRKYGKRMRILGILALCVGLWSLFESLIIQLLFGHSAQIHELTYILLIMIPYYLIGFVNASLELKWKYAKRISFSIVLLSVFIMGTQRIFLDRDFHDTLEVLHISIFMNIILALYMIIRSILYCKKNKIKNHNKAVPLSVSLFVLLSTLDIVRYQFDKGVNDSGTFMRIGIFITTVILSTDLIKNIILEIKNTEHMETMARLAYTDALTGMANRTAFEKKEKELEIRVMKGDIKKVFICQLDLNFLKKVNDNYGHAFGDRHIRACSKIINEVFGDHGFAFRVGGDEFTVFVTSDISEREFQNKIKAMKDLEAKHNKQSDIPVPLHMAIGYVLYTRNRFDNIKEAENEADRKMYEYKQAMKQKGDLFDDFEGEN